MPSLIHIYSDNSEMDMCTYNLKHLELWKSIKNIKKYFSFTNNFYYTNLIHSDSIIKLWILQGMNSN